MARGGRRFRLGLFALATAGLFFALLGFILQNSLNVERATYYLLCGESVKGMVVGSKVNFQGVPIGAVRDIRFQDGKTVVELRVDPTRATIQDVTTARLDRLLVTGQVTVELEGYGAKGHPLAPGSFLQVRSDPLHALSASVPEVVDRAAVVLSRLDALLSRTERLFGDDNLGHVASALANLDRATSQLSVQVVPEATALLQAARTEVVPAVAGISPAVLATLEDVRGVAAELARLAPEFRALAHEATALTGGVRGPVQSALAGLRQTLEDVRGLARQIKLAPDSLLFGVQRPAAPSGGER